MIEVRVRANPPPSVQWALNGRNISRYDRQVARRLQWVDTCDDVFTSQYEVQDDFSLLIRRPTAYNGGLYTLTASNGVAGPVAASTKVTAASWQPPNSCTCR